MFRIRIYIIVCFLIISIINLFSQEKIIAGSSEIPMLDISKTKAQYEYEVYQFTVNELLENNFGTTVTNNYERLLETSLSDGNKLDYHYELRNSYTNIYPNAVWIKDINEPKFQEYKDSKGIWWIKCEVKGVAKQIESSKIGFIAFTMDDTDYKKNESYHFIEGESGYMFFKSNVDGYLLIFYDDFKVVQRCFPYNTIKENSFKVKANRNYILFSRDSANYLENKNLVDEIEFVTDKSMDYNQFYVLFSPSGFEGYFLNEGENRNDGYSTFQYMDRRVFHNWLQKNRIKSKDLQVKVIGVSIKKRLF